MRNLSAILAILGTTVLLPAACAEPKAPGKSPDKPAPAASSSVSSPNICGETIEQTAARTGYTVEEIGKFFPPIEAWAKYGITPAPNQMAASFAAERFKDPPKPYVHPRVCFSPDDLPDLRRRLKETQVGRVQMDSMRGRLLQFSPSQQDWDSVPLKPTEADYRRFAERGLLIEARAGYRGPWVGGWVNELAAGRVPPELDGKWTQPVDKNHRQYLMHLLPYEAFRCLIDQDQAGGKRLAAALTTLAESIAKDMPKWTATDNWQAIYQFLSSGSLALAYDWGYPWMTDAQRATIRKTIADIVRGKQYIGLDHLPAFPGNTSNWNIIHANLLTVTLAIEGEEGYDEAVYLRIVEGLKKWVYVASGPDGAPFEGLVKSSYAPQWLIPLAKRGQPFIGSEWSRNHVRRYHLHVMLPWGRQFVFETGIAGPRDLAPFKYAHPRDPVIDLLYGATVEDYFSEIPQGRWVNIRTTYAPWWPAVMLADDPIGAQGATYDFDQAFDRTMAELSKTEPLSYYSDYHGVMSARTGWDRDAVMLYFEPRNVPGGHTRAGRNEFVLAGLGRLWAHRTEAVEDTSELHSVILIDGKGQGKSGGRCPAGRTLAFADSPRATFAAADAAWAYSHVLVSADHKQAQPVPCTPNDSRLEKSSLPWMSQPWSFLPNWATGCRPAPKQDPGGHGYWIDYNPVQYAYRTVGLVRGKHPYALVLDDIRKDDAEHLYSWLMQVDDDLQLAERSPGDPAQSHAVDLVLAEKTPDEGSNRRLLVRVLTAGQSADEAKLTQAEAKLESYETAVRNRVDRYQRLSLPLRAVTGHYLVLLYPHRDGQTVPQTAWSQDGKNLSVSWSDQKDVFRFAKDVDGRTRCELAPEGSQNGKNPTPGP